MCVFTYSLQTSLCALIRFLVCPHGFERLFPGASNVYRKWTWDTAGRLTCLYGQAWDVIVATDKFVTVEHSFQQVIRSWCVHTGAIKRECYQVLRNADNEPAWNTRNTVQCTLSTLTPHHTRLCAVRCTGPFHTPVWAVRRDVPVRFCRTAVIQMLFTIWIWLACLSLVLSRRELSSPNSLDLRTSQMATHRRDRCNAPRRQTVRKTQSLHHTTPHRTAPHQMAPLLIYLLPGVLLKSPQTSLVSSVQEVYLYYQGILKLFDFGTTFPANNLPPSMPHDINSKSAM